MSNNNNNNNRRNNANFNDFKNLLRNLNRRNVNPWNARKNENNAYRQDFERALGLKAGVLNFRVNPTSITIPGPNFRSNENFYNAVLSNNVNARRRLYKMIYS